MPEKISQPDNSEGKRKLIMALFPPGDTWAQR